MEFYLSVDGQKEGPVSLFKVREWVESGRVDRETLGWHRDMDGWKPIGEITALENLFDTSEEPAAVVEPPPIPEGSSLPKTPLNDPAMDPTLGPTPGVVVEAEKFNAGERRPLLRFSARMFDYTFVAVLVFLFSDIEPPQLEPGGDVAKFFARYLEQMQSEEGMILARTQLIALIVWQLIEGALIHMFGTTPGKALLGIRVVQNSGANLSIGRSIGRSFYVYVLGAGFYQFPFFFIGGVFSFFRLSGTGKCLWDQHLQTKVLTKPLSGLRIILAIAAFFILLLLQSAKFS
ncbi:MAG: RDD family protein [Verrucomicrobiota bacterium]